MAVAARTAADARQQQSASSSSALPSGPTLHQSVHYNQYVNDPRLIEATLHAENAAQHAHLTNFVTRSEAASALVAMEQQCTAVVAAERAGFQQQALSYVEQERSASQSQAQAVVQVAVSESRAALESQRVALTAQAECHIASRTEQSMAEVESLRARILLQEQQLLEQRELLQAAIERPTTINFPEASPAAPAALQVPIEQNGTVQYRFPTPLQVTPPTRHPDVQSPSRPSTPLEFAFCVHCGTNIYPAWANFCPACGQPHQLSLIHI